MSRELEFFEQVERSISKKFNKTIWRPFIVAVKKYRLIEAGDRIAVCVSGGKDSMLCAKLMQMLCRHSDEPFELVYLVMDPGYSAENRRRIEENARILNIPITVFCSDIFDVTSKSGGSPCYLCARMRRGNLYSEAKRLGCNKIALGHHLNDVIETTLMGMFYGAQLQSMPPMLHSKNFEGMSLIRPLYRVKEDAIIAWKKYNGLEFIRCACKLTEAYEADDERDKGKRLEMKKLIDSMKKDNPQVEKILFNAVHTVQLDTFPAFKSRGKAHSFLENYDLGTELEDE